MIDAAAAGGAARDVDAAHRVRASLFAADWPAPAGVRAFTTLRSPAGESAPPFDRFNLGDRCGDDAALVLANRAALQAALALPEAPRWLRQVHGAGVVRFERGDAYAGVEADAAVTSSRGVVLVVLTADCLPVVFAARDGTEIAVAHAGWRGLAQGVLEATLRAMRTPPHSILAWLGPAAGPLRYEVGEEVHRAFVDADAGAAAAFASTRRGHWHVDLFALARRRLQAAGVGGTHGGGECTLGNPDRFFSHRRDGLSGRMATVAFMA